MKRRITREESYSYYPEAYPATGSHDDDNDPDQDPDEDLDEDYEDYELDELEGDPGGQTCYTLKLAANAAFGKARGKGKGGKSKGKGKGNGKVVRSKLTLEQRRDKLRALKAKSKCLRCGRTGRWAGDPECKFPTNSGGKGQGPVKHKAHVAMWIILREILGFERCACSLRTYANGWGRPEVLHKGKTFGQVSRDAAYVR